MLTGQPPLPVEPVLFPGINQGCHSPYLTHTPLHLPRVPRTKLLQVFWGIFWWWKCPTSHLEVTLVLATSYCHCSMMRCFLQGIRNILSTQLVLGSSVSPEPITASGKCFLLNSTWISQSLSLL